jgi:hypothetical protein
MFLRAAKEWGPRGLCALLLQNERFFSEEVFVRTVARFSVVGE